MAVNREGEVIVTETDGKRFSVYDKNMKRKKRIRHHRPTGVAINDEGHIFIGDRFDFCVRKYGSDCKLIQRSSKDKYFVPEAIACNSDNGLIYVADNSTQSIKVFQQDLSSVVSKFGEFKRPTRVACVNGKVYVVDSKNHRIQVFEDSGEYSKLYEVGDGDCKFNEPIDIVVSHDKLIISDRYNHRICVCSSDGQILKSFTTPNGKNFDPCGMAMDDNFLYVCSHKQDNIQLFDVHDIIM